MSVKMQPQIDQLRKDMNAGFERVDARLDGHDRRFDTLDKTVRNVAVEQAKARRDIEWLKENMLTRGEFKTVTDRIFSVLDGQTRLFEEFRQRWAVQSDTLSQHEKRITRLEPRPQ